MRRRPAARSARRSRTPASRRPDGRRPRSPASSAHGCRAAAPAAWRSSPWCSRPSTSPSAIGSPPGPISRITSGETGSLKVSLQRRRRLRDHCAVGGLGLHQRRMRAGSPVDGASKTSSTTSESAPCAKALPRVHRFGRQLQRRRGLADRRPGLCPAGRESRSSDARPSRIPARPGSRASCRLRVRRRGCREDEFVVMGVGQLAADQAISVTPSPTLAP